jgi:hypothetical protein
MKRINALIVAAGAALSAPAFAETVTYYLWDPVQNTYVERRVERTVVYAAPSVTYAEPLPSVTEEIIVTAPRMTEDQAITADVVDRIATNPNISGRIGVETYNRDVTLTGRTVTEGQAERAEREAKSVEGVKEVTNLIRPRVGKF